VIAVVGVACGPLIDSGNVQNRADEVAGTIGSGGVIGQRFVSHCDRLSQIDVQIARFPDLGVGSHRLFFSIAPEIDGDGTPTPLSTSVVDEATLGANQWLPIAFSPINSSKDRAFILRVWSNGAETSPVTLWATSHRGTDERQRFTNRGPVAGSLVYRAYCDPTALAVAVERFDYLRGLGALWPASLILLLLPGLGIARLFAADDDDWGILLGHAVGWTVLVAPLGLVILGTVGAGRYEGFGLLAIGVAGLVIQPLPYGQVPLRSRLTVGSIVVIASALGAFAIRIATTTGLVVPMWVDSVQHAAITQSILDAGRVPETYGPFVPAEAFDYHFGFHALAAAVAALSGSTAPDAVLAVGQTLSALTPFAAYSFGRDLVGSKRAGAIAALLVGLVMTQPTYLITWGRYTELAGLVAMPVVIATITSAVEPARSRMRIITGAIALLAIVLVHPRVAAFDIALVVPPFVFRAVALQDTRWLARAVARGIALGMLAFGALLPWVLRLWSTQGENTFTSVSWQPIDFPIGIATAGFDRWVAYGAVIGLSLLVFRKPVIGLSLVVSSALILVAANPTFFGLPVYLWINNDSIAIGLFLPLSILAGYAIDQSATLLRFDRWPPLAAKTGAGAIVVVAFSLSPSVVGVVNACCSLASADDVAAWRWIRTSTPSDALFLINGYRWGDQIWAGTDAGYWLPVTASRRASLPPLFYATGPPAEKARVDAVAMAVDKAAGDPALIAADARKIGAPYVFVGSRGGVIDPGRLLESREFRMVYRAGGAWVFEVVGDGVSEGVGTGEGGTNSTVTAVTPVDVGTPKAEKAAGLRSVTSG
jgi:hypothetical protein